VKKISDNEIYLLIKYIKSVLRKVAKRLSCIKDARSLKVKYTQMPQKSDNWRDILYVVTNLDVRMSVHGYLQL